MTQMNVLERNNVSRAPVDISVLSSEGVHLKVPNSIIRKITVRQGDLGGRFAFLGAEQGVHNRALVGSHLKKLEKTWDEVACRTSVLQLIDSGQGFFFILDGQHRISTVSERLTRPVVFDARVYPASVLDDKELLLKLLTLPNIVSPQKSNDRLRSTQEMSPWPAIFANYGVSPIFDTKGRAAKLAWATCVVVSRNVKVSEELGEVAQCFSNAATGVSRVDLSINSWLDEDPAYIAEIAEAVGWWVETSAGLVGNKERRLATFGTLMVTAAVLVYRHNRDERMATLDGVRERLLTIPVARISELNSVLNTGSTRNMKSALGYLLGIGNHRRTLNLLTVFGRNGRE